MGVRLTILPSLLLALLTLRVEGQEPVPAASGDVVLASAISALARHDTITASLRQRICLFDQQLFGAGQYMQSGTGLKRRFRMEMTVQGKRQKIAITRICDGRMLWLLDGAEGEPTLRLVDLRRVEDALTMAGQGGAAVDWRAFDLGFGGLPRLLVMCDENFQFHAATKSNFDNAPAWLLRGYWQTERLQKMLNSQGGKPSGTPALPASLPSHLPNEVVLYLRQADLFPLGVEFRSVTQASGNQGMQSQILAAMDFFDARFDQPVDEKQFTGPEDMAQTDDTEGFLTRLGIARTPGELRAEQKGP
jgi:hypothetical protein